MNTGAWTSGSGLRLWARISARVRCGDFESLPAGLGAILSSINAAQGLVVEGVLHARSDSKSARFEAIWFAPSTDAYAQIAMLNTTNHSVDATLTLTDEAGAIVRNMPVSLNAHHTRWLNLSELMVQRHGQLGGISVQYDGLPGAILAQGFVLLPANGFSYNIPFADPATMGDAKFEGAGILLGPAGASSLPSQNLSGRLLLHNIGAGPVTATPTPQRGASRISLASVTLQAGEFRQVIVPPEAARAGHGAIGIEIPHTGNPGDVIAQWFSVDESGNLVAGTPLRSPPPDEHFSGSNPFLLSGDYSSVTYIKNTGDEVGHIFASIRHVGGE